MCFPCDLGLEVGLGQSYQTGLYEPAYHYTSSMGSGVENISYLIRPKEGSRGGSGKDGSGVGMILDTSKGKVYSYDIRLNFHASKDSMDYKALLARLIASVRTGMKDLHVFVGSKLLVDQVEGSRIPRTKEAKKYREDVMDATAPFHRFRITHIPKSLNLKAEALTGLAYIKLEFLNQEVSVGIKTRPTVGATRKGLKNQEQSKECDNRNVELYLGRA
uniref:RNase H type-1 domain-containing protein n=1 Tax=Tanacetum cinerariifolium TaxID=118510 RepID=A0A699GQ32_TANCI|nr:hypothetical protein [Tanacetum cinerariifolium]